MIFKLALLGLGIKDIISDFWINAIAKEVRKEIKRLYWLKQVKLIISAYKKKDSDIPDQVALNNTNRLFISV